MCPATWSWHAWSWRSCSVIELNVETSGLDHASRNMLAMIGQLNWVTARAMTEGAKAARDGIGREILPKVQGGPTTWTKRGLTVRFAKPNDLRAQAGFQYGEGRWEDDEFSAKGSGTPAGRYMGLNARGGDRRPKSSELQLRRSGVIGRNQYLTPFSGSSGINKHGNVPGPEYVRMMSQLKGFSAAGSSLNRTGSRSNYFVGYGDDSGSLSRRAGAPARFIAKRTGPGKRGFKPVFNVVDQPNYERKFPIKSVAMREFTRVFQQEMRVGFLREMARRGR